jgi:hypothetical protein
MVKPLPEILEEMDANIKAAAEAARRAEESRRLAREARHRRPSFQGSRSPRY